MRTSKLNAEASVLAARLQVTEAAARNIIKRCTEAGVDYTTFQPGQKLIKRLHGPTLGRKARTSSSILDFWFSGTAS